MRQPIILLLMLLLPLLAAAEAPATDARLDGAACRRIPTAPGPYSLLPLPGGKRLLISSHDRRHFEGTGDLYDYSLAGGTLRKLPRVGEPAGLVLRPQHMDLVTRHKETLLYLINHDDPTPNGIHHSILVYAVGADHLVFRQRLSDPLLSSPNHIAIAPDGDLYVSNDRHDGSSMLELLLRRSQANVVHYREGQGWRVVAEGLSFPNGVQAEAEEVLAVTSFGNAMLRWARYADGSLGPRQQVVSLPALDGLDPGPDPGTWLTVSQGPLLDYVRHRYDSTHPSPGTIFLVNTVNNSFTPFFRDDGRRISAMSSAVMAGKALFIGQTFDPFILRCPLRL